MASAGEVWIPIATLLIGFAASAALQSLTDRRLAAREERARQAEREQRRADRRNDFQRETILELQDAIGRLGRTTGAIYHHDLMVSRAAGGAWRRSQVAEGLSREDHEASMDVNRLAPRVQDERLRALVDELQNFSARLAVAGSEHQAEELFQHALGAFVAANERAGELLRELD